MSAPALVLRDKGTIPQVGLGLWKVKDAEQLKVAFNAAITAGYRHFDSAQAYGNEHMLGDAIAQSGVHRSELFITTKIAVQHFGHDKVHKTFAESLQKLQMEYVDLLLLHFPLPILRKKSWQALEELYKNGQAHHIGVSNYTIKHLQEMEKYATTMPVVNQVELHVFLQQPELVRYCQSHGIVVEAYSPLAHSRSMDDSVIAGIARKHHKSYAQIMLRWCIQQGLVILPKSVTPTRIQENIALFDFELDRDDLTAIAACNRNLRTCWDPTHIP
jgi:diketogulonate reductase-like aldo/keto reductase